MAKKQAWERFDDSFVNLDEALTDCSEYVTTTWEDGQATGVIVANETCDKLVVLDANDWVGKVTVFHAVNR